MSAVVIHCTAKDHLEPLVSPSEQDPSIWRAAIQKLSSQSPLAGLLFVALQTVKPSPSMYPPNSSRLPVGAYSGIFAEHVSKLLGDGEQIKAETGTIPGGLQTFYRMFGKDVEGEFVRFLVICNMANEYVLVDFSQSQASRAALLDMFRSPSIEKIVWNKEIMFKALQQTLWIRRESFNEVYDVSIPWKFGSGSTGNDIRYINEVSEYLRTPHEPASEAENGELAQAAAVIFHTKEIGEISGSSIIDLVLKNKADWIMKHAIVGWERIERKIGVSLAITAGALSDVAAATAILNPSWRMALMNACPPILSIAIEHFMYGVEIPKQCIKVVKDEDFSFPKCRYKAGCIHDVVTTANLSQKEEDQELANLQEEIDRLQSQKAELGQTAPNVSHDRLSREMSTPSTGHHHGYQPTRATKGHDSFEKSNRPSVLLSRRGTIRKVASLQLTDIPSWLRCYSVHRLPLFEERNEEWAKIPVPTLNLPAYLKSMDEKDPLHDVLIQWRRDYLRTIIQWKRTEPWCRMGVFLGALAIDAQLIACRIVDHLLETRSRSKSYSLPGLVGLLTEFCAYVKEVTRFDFADYQKIRQEPMMENLSQNETSAKPSLKNVVIAIPEEFRLFYSKYDQYPLAIIPTTTFRKLKDGVYIDPSITPFVSNQPNPYFNLLPAHIIPPPKMLDFVRKYTEQYNPVGKLVKSKAGDLDKGGHDWKKPPPKKARLDGDS